MMHRLFTVACVVSLLACTATAVLWVRSRVTSDGVTLQGRGGYFTTLISGDARLCLVRGTVIGSGPLPMLAPPGFADQVLGSCERATGSPRLGFGWLYDDGEFVLLVPDWAIVAATGTLPVVWGLPHHQIQRRRGQKCPGKDYGQTHSTGSGQAGIICPTHKKRTAGAVVGPAVPHTAGKLTHATPQRGSSGCPMLFA